MTDVLNLLMLIGACAAALAFGVLAAYAVLRGAFTLMRRQQMAHAPKPAAVKVMPQAAQIL